jgi:hypothetical protein
MSTIMDCITSLKDVAMVVSLWFGAAALMWLRDEMEVRKQIKENAKSPDAGETE